MHICFLQNKSKFCKYYVYTYILIFFVPIQYVVLIYNYFWLLLVKKNIIVGKEGLKLRSIFGCQNMF